LIASVPFVSDFWTSQVVGESRDGIFLVLAGFIVSFAFIRMSTRLMRSPRVSWWPGSVVSDSGVHLHHLVFGICLMILAGTVGFASSGTRPWFDIAAGLFGVGVGLTIDEFALWVYLDDVYWAEECRKSVDATVIAAAGMLLLLFGFELFDFTTSSTGEVVSSFAGAALVFAMVAVCFAKGRIMHGWVGFFVLPVDLRRLADRQARLAVGPALLRGAPARQADQGPGALPARSPHRALQATLPRHRRRRDRAGVRSEARTGRGQPRAGGREDARTRATRALRRRASR
jgi:hypothetical protein